jgi:catechol 2,3-dioxygenase-like lactoylglutathione lyase family enzyme
MQLRVLDYVVLIVEDLDRSLAFYLEVLGLPIHHRAGPYAQLVAGTTRLGLYERGAMSDTLKGPLRAPDRDAPGFQLGFKVEDVDAAHIELVERGASSAGEPITRHWGQRTAYVRDPDGHLIELAQDGVWE